MAEVYYNSKFIGTVEDPHSFVGRVRDERRMGSVTDNLNVYYNDKSNEVHIETSKGRARRPLIIVRDGQPLLTEKHIKQLEKNEISWSDLTPEHTHLEITPVAMFGFTTSLVPYGNYNQSTRLNAGSKNQKQALGLYASNLAVRMDMDVNLLHYPHVPVVKTIMHDMSHYDKHPAGQNIVVAVMSYKGYNMEDAIILNKASIDRGLGRSTYYRPSIAEELRYSGGLIDQVSIPDKDVKGYKTEKDYRFLE